MGEVAGWIATEAVAQGGELARPIEVEHYASHLASMWETATPVLGSKKSLAIGLSVVEWLRDCEDPVALVVLRGLAAVAELPVAELAARWSADPGGWAGEPAAWLESVGRAEVHRAGRLVDTDEGAGTTVLFALRWPGGEVGGIGVFIDHTVSGIAKHILVGPPIDEVIDELAAAPGARWEELSVGDAAALAREAMAVTESRPDRPVGETYVSQRAFLRAQLRRIGDGIAAEGVG